MVYSLGAVRTHVAAAANEIGPKFGIRVVYGWAPGLYDHPKGLALDLMTNNIPNGKQTGDALAAYALANADRLGITYVIWYRRIWSRERAGEGWRPYSGTSSHTDHVHLSFSSGGGTGGTVVPNGTGTTPLSIPGVDDVKTLIDTFSAFKGIADWLSDEGNLLRLGMGAFGAVLIIMALVMWGGKSLGKASGIVTVVKDTIK